MTVRITIEGDGLTFSADTELGKAGAVISFLTDPRQQTSASVNGPTLDTPKERRSPRQAIVDLGASTNPEKIAAFLRYFLDKEGRDSIKVKDIEQTFAKSGESKPRNIYRDVQKAIELGFISESDSQSGAYSLTDLGLEVTQIGFKSTTK